MAVSRAEKETELNDLTAAFKGAETAVLGDIEFPGGTNRPSKVPSVVVRYSDGRLRTVS